MDPVNLRNIDLNLLVVLDALLAECHVTRAGARLGLSQPATSNALERLRQLLGDPILERTPQGMRPTPRAEALRPRLREILDSVAHLVRAARPDLATIEQTIRLSIVDYGVELIVGPLYRALRSTAPGVDLAVLPWTGADRALDALAEGAIDLAVSVVAPGAGTLRWHSLMREEYVVVMRKGHPAARGFGLERWLAYPHVVVSGRGETAGALDAALAERGHARRVAVVVPSFLAVPGLLVDSDLIALLPTRALATASARPALVTRAPPISVPGFEVGLAWHTRRDDDLATAHVREHITRIVASLPPHSRPARQARTRQPSGARYSA
jgi:DNA-binding transcriptional LysR family regulator